MILGEEGIPCTFFFLHSRIHSSGIRFSEFPFVVTAHESNTRMTAHWPPHDEIRDSHACNKKTSNQSQWKKVYSERCFRVKGNLWNPRRRGEMITLSVNHRTQSIRRTTPRRKSQNSSQTSTLPPVTLKHKPSSQVAKGRHRSGNTSSSCTKKQGSARKGKRPNNREHRPPQNRFTNKETVYSRKYVFPHHSITEIN